MTKRESFCKQDAVCFPDNKIILLDGSKVDCFPRKDGNYGRVDYNNVELDTTGEYLAYDKKVGRSKCYIEDLDAFCERPKTRYEAYSLQQVLELLKPEGVN